MKLSIGLPLLIACATPAPTPPSPIAIKKHPPLMVAPPACSPADLVRTEVKQTSEPGIEVFIVHIAAPADSKRGAIVFTHGAGSAGSALWDLTPVDYSLMRKLACEGYDTYSVDMRGFGGSTMPAAMREDATKNPPVSRANDVQPDVDAAVRYAMAKSKVDRVSMFAWSWGCVVAGRYASDHPDLIERLVLFAPVYDRKWPKRHITDRAWRVEKKQLFFDYHDPKREDRAVLEAHVSQLFRFTKGPELRLPNGPYQDLYGADAPIWDPSKIRSDTLVVRGESDRASLEEHAYKLFSDLTQAHTKQYVVLGGAGHFAFRTHRYKELQDVVLRFFTR